MRMKGILKTGLTITIIIGLVGLALVKIFGEGVVSYLNLETINGQTLYKMDIWGYIDNIRTNVTDVSTLNLDLPNRGFNNDIINNFKAIADYLILIGNVLIYPFRLGGYLMRLLMVLVGYNFNNPNQNITWLVNLVNGLISAQIPYV